MNINSIKTLFENLLARGWSADNIAVGMGGGLLQGVTRDTLKWAMKCSAACIDGEWRDVYKDPITDQGKKSKKGRLSLIHSVGLGNSSYVTVRQEAVAPGQRDLLDTVFENGQLLVDHSFADVRARSNLS
jgi:nicotinamide phosphoribosyltransferase